MDRRAFVAGLGAALAAPRAASHATVSSPTPSRRPSTCLAMKNVAPPLSMVQDHGVAPFGPRGVDLAL
jgi:hypothetical protein